MFGIVPLLFQNAIFYNTVIYCYMCDSTGNVQCRLKMEHSHRVFPLYIPRVYDREKFCADIFT